MSRQKDEWSVDQNVICDRVKKAARAVKEPDWVNATICVCDRVCMSDKDRKLKST